MALTEARKQEIARGYQSVCARIDACAKRSPFRQNVTLVAASKTRSAEEINYAHSLGLSSIGENRVQELLAKYDDLDRDLDVQFIGALQTNKVKYIIDKVSLIHSVDREDLALEIEKQAAKRGLIAKILCEVNLGEAQKSGIEPEKLDDLLCFLSKLPHVRVLGLMAVLPVCGSFEQQFEICSKFMKIFVDKKAKNIDNISMQISSLGMSGDFPAAIAAGANTVRIGSAIFGARDGKQNQ